MRMRTENSFDPSLRQSFIYDLAYRDKQREDQIVGVIFICFSVLLCALLSKSGIENKILSWTILLAYFAFLAATVVFVSRKTSKRMDNAMAPPAIAPSQWEEPRRRYYSLSDDQISYMHQRYLEAKNRIFLIILMLILFVAAFFIFTQEGREITSTIMHRIGGEHGQ